MLLFILFTMLDTYHSIKYSRVETEPSVMVSHASFECVITPLMMFYLLTAYAYGGVLDNNNSNHNSKRRTPSIFFSKLIKLISRLTMLLMFLFTLNIMLLVICNMSLLNPGPKANNNKTITVFYNNIQGLINRRDLPNSRKPDTKYGKNS